MKLRNVVAAVVLGLLLATSIPAAEVSARTARPRHDPKLAKEVRQVQKTITDLRQQHEAGGKEAVVAKVREMVNIYGSHPALTWVLLCLAQFREREAPGEAITLLKHAIDSPLKTDSWDSGRQKAIQQLSALYEEREEYEKAAEILMQWKVSGWCGTGVAKSRANKMFGVLRLRMHYDDPDKVLAEMWQRIEAGEVDLLMGPGDVGVRIRSLYGEKRLEKPGTTWSKVDKVS